MPRSSKETLNLGSRFRPRAEYTYPKVKKKTSTFTRMSLGTFISGLSFVLDVAELGLDMAHENKENDEDRQELNQEDNTAAETEKEEIYGKELGVKEEVPVNMRMSETVAKRIEELILAPVKDKDLDKTLKTIPRTSRIDLEAPKLNLELDHRDLSKRSHKKDNYFVKYHNLVGSSLTAVASAYSMIVEDDIPSKETLTDCLSLSNYNQS